MTIDRVLFSYCVKNDIPAIYSGTEFFIFFNPLGSGSRGGTITNQILMKNDNYFHSYIIFLFD